MKKELLILMTLLISVIGYSQTFTALDNNNNTLEFEVISGTTVEVNDYISGGTDIDIPSTVLDNGITYSVTEIGALAFNDNGITSVVIPTTVINIGNGAFINNTLTAITIPNSVTNIGGSAFINNQLANVTVPGSVSNIGSYAFQNNALTTLTLENGLSSIGQFAFTGNQLTSLSLPSSVVTIGDVAFQANPLSCIISEATTPPSINSSNSGLDTFSFAQRSNIDLSIPSGTSGAYASATWTGFNSVAEGLTGTFVIDNITYQINPSPNNEVTVTNYNTAGGTVVNIPETVTSACTTFTVTDIGDFSLDNINLTSLALPDSLVNIGENAFAFNDLLSITIPDSVVMIGDGAFAQNNNMTSVTIGSSVAIIGEYAFRFNSINNLVIPDNVLSIESLAFNSNSITNLDLGNGVQTIGDNAFRFNGLQTVTIPASVTSIGDGAFFLPLLTDVYTEGIVPPTITTSNTSADSFFADRSTIHLHIPAGTLGAYVTDPGALWTGFNPVTEDALSIDEYELTNHVKIINTENVLKVIASNSLQLNNYEVYTLTGAKITTGNTLNISTETWTNGIYILKLDFDRGTVTKKVVVK
ncbi:leucine-rich repeat domain-containing protein [uncultured Psychroserpens sp.]|uniref:leucine-rich repeat domain-containing protein n=1 Tax=uncultured Psychroserpens sp. TaxID=255436 RepID=UPI002608FFE6|nr:leucine-rich repeat domain-containing protein [uncultured Psychroserpens sp.]